MAYDDILNTTGAIFLTAACLAWAPGAGLYNPILVLIVYTIAKMIIGVGSGMVSCFVSFVIICCYRFAHTCCSRIASHSRKIHLDMMNLTCLLRSSVKRLTGKSLRLVKERS